MISRITTNRMKAAAIAAVMCISATAFAIPSYVNLDAINPVTVSAAGNSLSAGDTYNGFTADVATSGLKTITITLTADYTGNFSYGFGIGTADAPYWYEWDGKGWVDTKGGTVEVEGVSVPVTAGQEFTISIDTSSLGLSYNPSTDEYPGKFEFRNYYSGEDGGTVSVKSVTANGASAPSTPTTPDTTDTTEATEPSTPSTPSTPGTSTGNKLFADDVYNGFTADLASSGIKNITVTVTPDYTGNFSYGFGIGTADSPYWYEWNGKGWEDTSDGSEVPGTDIAATAGQDIVIVIDTSKLSLSYNPKTDEYPGKFEFRNYYSGEDGGSVTIKSIVANSDAEATKPSEGQDTTEDDHALANKDGQNSSNSVSGTWTFNDNKDGTGTMTATQARQIEFETPLTLTQGYDEDYYAEQGVKPVEGTDPINSHKFSYSDFGLSGVGDSNVIESLMATIQSSQSVKNFMYGGGLNVENQSPADTEAAKAAKGVASTDDAGYWYNDMGEENVEKFEAAGVEFGITPGYGYFLSSDTNQLGSYFNVIWDVPEAVKPYETSGEISFQYWYGVEDAEEYTEIPAVDLIGGILTYTETQTFDYTDRKKVDVNRTIESGEMSGEISFMDDLGLEATNDVHAVVFTVSADSDLDKLVYGIGASVGEDWQQWAPEDAKWDYVITNQKSGDIEIAWIAPSGADLNEEYGNIQFGYWYGGQGENELGSITLKSVEVFYSESEEPTEESTEDSTEESDEPLTAILWGDADCDGSVNILDVIAVNRVVLGKDKGLTPQGFANADINVNGVLEAVDSLNILKMLVNIITADDCPVV